MKTIEELCDINWLTTTANIRFRPRAGERRVTIPGLRDVSLDQDIDASWLVIVRDAGVPADGEDERMEQTHSIRIKDPAGIAVLNAIVELLASPEDHLAHEDILGPDEPAEAAD